MKNYLDGIKENCKTKKIKNFLSECDFFYNAECSENRITPTLMETLYSITDNGICVKKIYNVEGKIYYYFENGFLYEGNGNVLKKVAENKFLAPPKIMKAPSNFLNSILFIDGKNAFIRGDFNGKIFVPLGKDYLVVEDTVFLFNENHLYFDCRKDDNFLLKDDCFGRIDVNSSLGSILHLENVGNSIIVFCEYGITALSLLSDKKDYVLEGVVALPLSIRENTIKKIGEDCFFVSGKQLCKFSDKKVTYMPFFMEDKSYSILGQCFSIKDYYCLPINYKGNNYIYMQSAVFGTYKIVTLGDKLWCDNGFLFDRQSCSLQLLETGLNQKFTFITERFDFGNLLNKQIKSICIFGQGEFLITFNGNIESKSYKTKANKILNRINFQANNFSITINSLTDNSTIDEIEINYIE